MTTIRELTKLVLEENKSLRDRLAAVERDERWGRFRLIESDVKRHGSWLVELQRTVCELERDKLPKCPECGEVKQDPSSPMR